MEILKPHFSDEEIQQIQELPDFAEIREQIIEKQVNIMLDRLDEVAKKNFQERLKAAKDVRDKLRIFMNPENQPELETKKGAGFDFSHMTLDGLRKKAKEGLSGAKEALKAKTDEVIETEVTKFKEGVKGVWWSKIIPEKFIDWAVDNSKEYASGKIDGIKGWIVGFIIGLFPGGKLLMGGLEKVFGNSKSTEKNSDIKPEVAETPVNSEKNEGEESGSEGTTPEVVQERFDITKKGVYESTGYRIIALQSGIETSTNIEATGIYAELGDESIQDINEVFISTNRKTGGALAKALNIEANISDERLEKIVLGIVGPFQNSFLKPSLGTLAGVKGILYNSENSLYPGIHNVFNQEELNSFKKVNYDYRKMSLSSISRLISLYWASLGNTSLAYLSKTTQGVGNSTKKFLFGGELIIAIDRLGIIQNQSTIFPEKIANLFMNIPSGQGYLGKSGAEIIELFGKGIEFSEAEITQINNFIAFGDEAIREIPLRFSFEMPGFKEAFTSKIDYGNLASLYLLTQGNREGGVAFSQFDTNQDLLVYGWLISMLGEHQLRYITAIGNTLREDSDNLSEDEANILLVLSYRILEGQRNGVIKQGKNILGAGHDIVKYTLPESLSESTKDIVAYLIESIGAVGAWKLLGKITPVGRTVMFITAGVGIGALYYFSGEVGYQQLDAKRRNILDTFLEENFPKDGSSKEIRQKIDNGDIPISSLYDKGDTVIFSLFQ